MRSKAKHGKTGQKTGKNGGIMAFTSNKLKKLRREIDGINETLKVLKECELRRYVLVHYNYDVCNYIMDDGSIFDDNNNDDNESGITYIELIPASF